MQVPGWGRAATRRLVILLRSAVKKTATGFNGILHDTPGEGRQADQECQNFQEMDHISLRAAGNLEEMIAELGLDRSVDLV